MLYLVVGVILGPGGFLNFAVLIGVGGPVCWNPYAVGSPAGEGGKEGWSDGWRRR